MPRIENIEDLIDFKIQPSTTEDVNIPSVEFSLKQPEIDYCAFMSPDSSMLDNLLIDRMNISLPIEKEIIHLDSKGYDQSVSNDDSYSSSSSSENDDSDEDNKKSLKSNSKNNKTKGSPRSSKKPQNENDKRAFIMQLNQEYTNQLSSLNEDVVRAYKKWKDLESKGLECEYAMKEWMFLNKKYTTLKRRNAREIFDKVQSMNRKMNVNSNVYDLHGQGVKCGNLQYILKRIFNNEEKKINSNEKNENGKFVLDIGNEKDGDWHIHAKFLVLSFLTTRKTNYQLDEEKRYITVQL